jgi:hypothetical protein
LSLAPRKTNTPWPDHRVDALRQGVALEEIDSSKLAVNDPAYPVIITLRAEKL